MSAVEFGIRPQVPFLHQFPEEQLGQLSTNSNILANRYETLSQLSRLIASMTLEEISRRLTEILRPLLYCDLANIIIFPHQDNNLPLRSLGATQLGPVNSSTENTTVWSTYQDEKPLWVGDWQTDDRLAVRKEAESFAVGGYR